MTKIKKNSNPLAVVLSDVHFNVRTKDIAAYALNAAVDKAAELGVSLIIAGDLNDTKAILRGECIDLIIKAMMRADELGVAVYVLVGNHDLINEKGSTHSLEFLRPYAHVIDVPQYLTEFRVWFIPYQNDSEKFLEILARVPKGANVVMHQGVRGAFMGDYVIDKTSIDPALLSDYKVISGHYHRAQTVGTIAYIGNPYTVSASEANDGPKGFQILKADFSMEQVVLPLRKHVTVECTTDTVLDPIEGLNPEDILWLKVRGPSLELDKLDKKIIGERHLGHRNFKLDKIATDKAAARVDTSKLTDAQIVDSVIDKAQDVEAPQKKYLKQLWREVMNENH